MPEYNILTVVGSFLGYKYSIETIVFLSKANKGKNYPMFGITSKDHPRFDISLSDDVIINISETQKKMDKIGGNNPMYSKHHCSETIAKMNIVKGGGTIYVYDIHGSFRNSFSSIRKNC